MIDDQHAFSGLGLEALAFLPDGDHLLLLAHPRTPNLVHEYHAV